jgi:hypothetical protein
MRKTFYILSILILALNSCKKEETPQKINCGLSNDTSNITSQDLINCKYITGSYWVYVDSVNLQYDSVYISNYSQGFMDEPICNNMYEHHSFQTVSSPSNNTENYAVVSGGLFKNVNGVNSGTQIYNDYSSANSFTNFVIDRFDSIYVYNQYYYNVLKVTVDNDHSEQNKKSVYYINSDFGFLKHEVYQNSTLNSNKILIDKNIIR